MSGGNKVAIVLIVIVLILLVGFGGYLIGSQQRSALPASPTPVSNLTAPVYTSPSPEDQMMQASPSASPIISPSPSPSAEFKVSAATAAVAPSTASACPTTFTFTGKVTANKAGTITYRWERSDNATGTIETLTFDAASTQTVTTSWSLSNPGTKWERLHILSPNELVSNQASFTLSCP